MVRVVFRAAVHLPSVVLGILQALEMAMEKKHELCTVQAALLWVGSGVGNWARNNSVATRSGALLSSSASTTTGKVNTDRRPHELTAALEGRG